MTTPAPEAEPLGRIEFSTTDLDSAIDYLSKAYRTTLRVSGGRSSPLFAHSRADGGLFVLDEVRYPADLAFRIEPLPALIVLEIDAGRFERDYVGVSQRFEPGDVFVADPSLPATVRMHELEVRTMMLDLGVLAQVASTAPTRVPSPVRLTGYQPTSAGAATNWKRTVGYMRELLANDNAVSQPLIRANAARMLAATALSTFPNTAVTDPTGQERHDATTATLRRAIAFIEQHAHADISLMDIAAASNVSVRAVQFAFRRHRDTTPMAYLRAVRLDRVHHELLAADPSRGATVTDIATRWGFYNHSRFAARYRHTYRTTPRHTLHTH